MPTLLKKNLTVFVFIFVFSFSFLAVVSPSPARASQFIDAMTAPGMNMQKYIIGEDIISPQGTQGMTSTLIDGLIVMSVGARDKNGNLISTGATGSLFALMDQMQQKPVISTKDYLAYYQNRLRLVPPAYAQSQGFEFLKPVIDLWIISRNIVYLFFVVIFVTIGFMIMFRSKLNPQTVINIQLALPNIVVALILVTFSFAICGFIVDIAYLGNGLIYNIFHDKLTAIISAADPALTFWHGDATPVTMIKTMGFGTNLLTALAAAKDLWNSSVAVLLNLVIAITVLSVSFKIFFNLLTKYVTLLLIAILSPFALLVSAIPSANQSALNIFKQVLSAVLVFPATYFMVNLAYFFSVYALVTGANFKDITPFPITSFISPDPDLAMASLSGLLALGILMTATQIPQVIDQAFETQPSLGAGTGEQIGGALRKLPIIGGLIG